MIEIMDGLSKDMEADEREKLKAVFPQCFTEGRLDIDKLLSLCGEYIDDDFEKYEFKWKGKAECLKLAQKRSTATLRPCPEESVNFDTTKNLYIEGDNLEVLKLLQASYYRQVKMIYIDPPYNTGHDFIYEDDFKDTLARYKEVTSQTTRSNPESMGRFHTNWLNMMYPRLRLAASLLRDDGVIFISIDDHEVHNLRKLCDEVFGEENFIAQILWQKKYAVSNDDPGIAPMHDFILAYQKSNAFQRNLLPRTEKQLQRYNNLDNDPRGDWSSDNYISNKSRWERPTLWYPIKHPNTGADVWPDENAVWRYSQEKHDQMVNENRLYWGPNMSYERPRIKRFLSEIQNGIVPSTWWPFTDVGHNDEAVKETGVLMGKKVFSTPKPIRLLKQLLIIGSQPNSQDIILDFFSGSSATAHAVMHLNAEDGGNRRFIMVQLPELCDEQSEAFKAGYKNICEIGKERICRAGQKIKDEQGKGGTKLDFESEHQAELDTGFKVFKLDSSNLETWDPSPITSDQLPLLEERLNRMTERVKPDRSDLDMVYEIMLKQGLPLTESVTPLDIEGFTVYSVRDDSLLLVCLEKDVSTEVVKQMAALAPARIIFGQDCFPDMTAMSNAKLSLRDAGIDFKFV